MTEHKYTAKMMPFFMKTAFMLAENSQCVSHRVGAIIVKDSRIISIGYNGTPPGMMNCNELFDKEFDRAEHNRWSSQNEIHAEMNALAFAAKHGLSVEGCDMYVTISPCNDCLKNLVMNGIENVYYYKRYDKSDMNPVLLEKINVSVIPDPDGRIKRFIDKNELLYEPKKK